MIRIRFTCGHEGHLNDSAMSSPVCHCGERQISVVFPSRPPRFTGTVTGPHAEYRALDAIPLSLATAPLPSERSH